MQSKKMCSGTKWMKEARIKWMFLLHVVWWFLWSIAHKCWPLFTYCHLFLDGIVFSLWSLELYAMFVAHHLLNYFKLHCAAESATLFYSLALVGHTRGHTSKRHGSLLHNTIFYKHCRFYFISFRLLLHLLSSHTLSHLIRPLCYTHAFRL